MSDILTSAPVRRRPFGLVVAAASVPMFMATLDNLVMTNALPVLHQELGASVEELQWFMNAYTLAFASAILVASALGDRFGRRTVFVIGIAVFGIGSALAALSTDPGQLIAARALQGFGGAGVLPLSLALLAGGGRAESPPARDRHLGRRSRASASRSGRSSAARSWRAGTGRRSSGSTSRSRSSRSRFALLALNNDFGARARIDVVGALLAAGGVLALVHAIVRGNDDGWSSFSVIAEITVGVVLLLAFVGWQARAKAPLVPLRLFRDRSFSLTNIVGFAFTFGTFGAVFILIQYMQVVQGSTPLEAAVQTTPWTLAPMFVAPIAGIIAPRVGTRVLMLTGLLLQGVALTWIGLTLLDRPRLPRAHRAVHHGRRRHGARLRPVRDGAARDPRRHRPRQGLRRELDGPRDRHRPRHGRHDRDLRERGRRAAARPLRRRRAPRRAHRRRGALRRSRRRVLAARRSLHATRRRMPRPRHPPPPSRSSPRSDPAHVGMPARGIPTSSLSPRPYRLRLDHPPSRNRVEPGIGASAISLRTVRERTPRVRRTRRRAGASAALRARPTACSSAPRPRSARRAGATP